MRDLRSILPVLLLALLAGCITTGSMPTPIPTPDGFTLSGTFTIRENQAMRLAVGTAGEGTLIFQGWQYPFLFENAKLDVAGNEPVEVHGTVFNLQHTRDFEGVYKPIKAEIEAGEGLSGIWVRNKKDVVLYIVLQGMDVAINLEATGGKITLK